MTRLTIAAALLAAFVVLLGAVYRAGAVHERAAINAASDRARIETLTESNERTADVEALDDDGLRDELLRRVRGGAGH